MPPHASRDWINIVDALGPTLVGLIRLPVLFIQLRSFLSQLKSQASELETMRQQVVAGTLGHLYLQQNTIHQFFITNADLRPYFYENEDAPRENPEVAATSEMLVWSSMRAPPLS